MSHLANWHAERTGARDMTTNTSIPEISMYLECSNGAHARGFVIDGCSVLVFPESGDDTRVVQLVTKLAAAAVETAPRRLIGTACVRIMPATDTHPEQLYLLNRREGGWSSFAIQLNGWECTGSA
jgi:hypothetical protein